MTDREKAIVMAYTGVCMLTGEKINKYYAYVDEIMGRPVYTHEMGTKVVDNLIKEKAKPDFIALCREDGAQYTEAEIQKMQELEFAEIQKAYEIGKDEGSEVLDKIRAEIDSYCGDNRDRNDGLYIAMKIIDKYKASPTGAEGSDKE